MFLFDGLGELTLIGVSPIFLRCIQSNLENSLVFCFIFGDILFVEFRLIAVLVVHAFPQLIYLPATVSPVASIVSSPDTISMLGTFGQ